jgi:hypothetical protein
MKHRCDRRKRDACGYCFAELSRPPSQKHRFCSPNCRRLFLSGNRPYAICRVCGIRFPVKHGMSGKYCCVTCARDSHRRPVARCHHCSKEFRPKLRKQKFCCCSCANFNKHRKHKMTIHTLSCHACGNPFLWRSRPNGVRRRLCSNLCQDLYRIYGQCSEAVKFHLSLRSLKEAVREARLRDRESV